MKKSLEKELTAYFDRLSEAEQQSVINLLKTITEEKEGDWTKAEIDEYNKELDMAMEEMDKGELYTHDEAVAILKDRNNAKKAKLA